MDRRLLAFGVVLLAACALIGTVVVVGFVGVEGVGDEYEAVWEAEPASAYGDGHHEIAAASSDGAASAAPNDDLTLTVPANDADAETCGLAGLDADGETRWETDVADGSDCTPHGIGGAATAEFDDETVVVVADQTGQLRAYDAATGEIRFTYELNGEGFATPAVADVTGDGREEVVVTDFDGTVHVVDADGEPVWTRTFDGTTATGPLVGDFTEDGETEVAVAFREGGEGTVVALDADGDELWRTDAGSGITSWTFATVEEGAGESPVIVAGVGSGTAVAFEADTGDVRWETKLQDGTVRVGETSPGRVLVSGTGTVWSIDLEDSSVVWRQQIGGNSWIAPPVVGDVSGDGDLDVAVVGRGGSVSVISAATGSVSGNSHTGNAFFTRPILVDVTGDGSRELVVLRDDGRVVVLSLLD